jgi:hypothetical protein
MQKPSKRTKKTQSVTARSRIDIPHPWGNQLSVQSGDLIPIEGHWYVTHAGLQRLAARRRCREIEVQTIPEFSNALNRRYVFKATVHKSQKGPGFVGYGDADPSNVSALVRGAEMRVAETRGVNRALRRAYGIGMCSAEEIGSFAERQASSERKLPPQTSNGNGTPRSMTGSAK